MTNRYNTTLYVGVTSDIEGRVWEHKNNAVPGSFTARYNLKKLVHYEHFQNINDAINREKQLKGGSRSKKLKLVLDSNPGWRDLSEDFEH